MKIFLPLYTSLALFFFAYSAAASSDTMGVADIIEVFYTVDTLNRMDSQVINIQNVFLDHAPIQPKNMMSSKSKDIIPTPYEVDNQRNFISGLVFRNGFNEITIKNLRNAFFGTLNLHDPRSDKYINIEFNTSQQIPDLLVNLLKHRKYDSLRKSMKIHHPDISCLDDCSMILSIAAKGGNVDGFNVKAILDTVDFTSNDNGVAFQFKFDADYIQVVTTHHNEVTLLMSDVGTDVFQFCIVKSSKSYAVEPDNSLTTQNPAPQPMDISNPPSPRMEIDRAGDNEQGMRDASVKAPDGGLQSNASYMANAASAYLKGSSFLKMKERVRVVQMLLFNEVDICLESVLNAYVDGTFQGTNYEFGFDLENSAYCSGKLCAIAFCVVNGKIDSLTLIPCLPGQDRVKMYQDWRITMDSGFIDTILSHSMIERLSPVLKKLMVTPKYDVLSTLLICSLHLRIEGVVCDTRGCNQTGIFFNDFAVMHFYFSQSNAMQLLIYQDEATYVLTCTNQRDITIFPVQTAAPPVTTQNYTRITTTAATSDVSSSSSTNQSAASTSSSSVGSSFSSLFSSDVKLSHVELEATVKSLLRVDAFFYAASKISGCQVLISSTQAFDLMGIIFDVFETGDYSRISFADPFDLYQQMDPENDSLILVALEFRGTFFKVQIGITELNTFVVIIEYKRADVFNPILSTHFGRQSVVCPVYQNFLNSHACKALTPKLKEFQKYHGFESLDLQEICNLKKDGIELLEYKINDFWSNFFQVSHKGLKISVLLPESTAKLEFGNSLFSFTYNPHTKKLITTRNSAWNIEPLWPQLLLTHPLIDNVLANAISTLICTSNNLIVFPKSLVRPEQMKMCMPAKMHSLFILSPESLFSIIMEGIQTFADGTCSNSGFTIRNGTIAEELSTIEVSFPSFMFTFFFNSLSELKVIVRTQQGMSVFEQILGHRSHRTIFYELESVVHAGPSFELRLREFFKGIDIDKLFIAITETLVLNDVVINDPDRLKAVTKALSAYVEDPKNYSGPYHMAIRKVRINDAIGDQISFTALSQDSLLMEHLANTSLLRITSDLLPQKTFNVDLTLCQFQ